MKRSKEFYEKNLQSLSFSSQPSSEQETVIVFKRGEDCATVETTDSTVLTKLKKCAAASPKDWKLDGLTVSSDEEDPFKVSSVCFTCPKKLVSLRTKPVQAREMTDEERAVAAERLRAVRSHKE